MGLRAWVLRLRACWLAEAGEDMTLHGVKHHSRDVCEAPCAHAMVSIFCSIIARPAWLRLQLGGKCQLAMQVLVGESEQGVNRSTKRIFWYGCFCVLYCAFMGTDDMFLGGLGECMKCLVF